MPKGFECNGLWLLKTQSLNPGRKNFALGCPTTDFLSFPDILYPPNFGGLGENWTFSTATPGFNSYRVRFPISLNGVMKANA
jgi:hypothetical protein